MEDRSWSKKEWEKIENDVDKIGKFVNKGIIRIANARLFLTIGATTSIYKMIKINMPEQVKKQVMQDKIYHFASEKSAELIMKSGNIRSGKGLGAWITSYGKPAVFAFMGLPPIEDLLKNVSGRSLLNDKGANVFLDPNLVMDAIEISPEYNEMSGWKIRPFSDSAVIIEGAYLLPKERTRHVKVGMDLERDEKGKPIFDYEHKKYKIVSRVLEEKDFDEHGNYVPPKDFLDVVTRMSEELGFSMKKKNKILEKFDEITGKKHIKIRDFLQLNGNRLNHVLVGAQFEREVYMEHIRKNPIRTVIKNLKRTPKLIASREEMIQSELENSSFNTTNPSNRVKKVTEYAGKIMAEEGIYQESVSKMLSEINSSEVGQFMQKKLKNMDLSGIPQLGLHGMSHSNNAMMLGLRIAQKQGILENDKNDRLKDILTTALQYHDLGRVRFGIAWDYGRHAERSVKKLEGKNITFLNGEPYSENDMNILKLIIEGHETKSDDEFFELAKKYNIQESEMDMVNNLFKIVKDADALHRVRLDKAADKIFLPGVRGSVDLDFNYLRSPEAKSLIFAAYEFDSLSKKIPTSEFPELLKYGTEDRMKDSKTRAAFVKTLEVSDTVKTKIQEVITANKVKNRISGYRTNEKGKTYSEKESHKLKKFIEIAKKKTIEFLKDENGYLDLE